MWNTCVPSAELKAPSTDRRLVKMVKTLTLALCAILSLSVGIACASPLLVSELVIQPWINHIQGPTAELGVNVVYANFTVANVSEPVENDSGPSIYYQIVVNLTNPSSLGANLLHVAFSAAQKITYYTGEPPMFANGISGSGWTAEGAWVDGIWYNVTYSNGTYPSTNRDGSLAPARFNTTFPSRWKAGVEIYDVRYYGTLTTYLNMNGTWVNVTGRINVTRPPPGHGWATTGNVISQMDTFESLAVREYSSEGTYVQTAPGGSCTVHHLVENGYFDNLWASGQSRLIMINGSWNIRKPFSAKNALETLRSLNVTLKTTITNFVKTDQASTMQAWENNTVIDTWSDETELKQVQLKQSGDSYIYNTILDANHVFQTDKWGVEVFLKPRS